MRRFFLAFFIGLFSLSVLDIPFYASRQVKQCCCHGGICRCPHRTGTLCPLKGKTETAGWHQGQVHQKHPPAFFKSSACGFDNEKTAPPVYLKDCLPHTAAVIFRFDPPSFSLSEVFLKHTFLFDLTLDKPPKILL